MTVSEAMYHDRMDGMWKQHVEGRNGAGRNGRVARKLILIAIAHHCALADDLTCTLSIAQIASLSSSRYVEEQVAALEAQGLIVRTGDSYRLVGMQ